MPEPRNILLYGRDRYLNESRSLVLRKSGFKVHTALRPREFESAEQDACPDLVILCHSLSQEECRQAITTSLAHWPGAQRLSLYSGTRGCSDGDQSEVMDISEGPANLIARVRRMVAQRDSGSISVH